MTAPTCWTAVNTYAKHNASSKYFCFISLQWLTAVWFVLMVTVLEMAGC